MTLNPDTDLIYILTRSDVFDELAFTSPEALLYCLSQVPFFRGLDFPSMARELRSMNSGQFYQLNHKGTSVAVRTYALIA